MIKSGAMSETPDVYEGGTEPGDFAEADLPDVITGGEADGLVDEGYGFTVDPKTGERRAKKAPGRPRKQPTAEELAKAPPVPREPDKPPQPPTGKRDKPPADDDKVPPMPRGNQIAKGVNKLYRRAGKIVRGMEDNDPDGIGQAFIDCTKVNEDEPEDERELTVGEAWEALARSNPRIRAFLLKILVGGDIGDLLMAHLPIGIALVGKPWVQRFIKPGAILESMSEPDEDEEEGTSLPGGLTRQDLQDMQDLTEEQAAQVARKMASGMGVHLSDADIARAVKQAENGGIPQAFRRQQPKKQTRSQRTGAR